MAGALPARGAPRAAPAQPEGSRQLKEAGQRPGQRQGIWKSPGARGRGQASTQLMQLGSSRGGVTCLLIPPRHLPRLQAQCSWVFLQPWNRDVLLFPATVPTSPDQPAGAPCSIPWGQHSSDAHTSPLPGSTRHLPSRQPDEPTTLASPNTTDEATRPLTSAGQRPSPSPQNRVKADSSTLSGPSLTPAGPSVGRTAPLPRASQGPRAAQGVDDVTIGTAPHGNRPLPTLAVGAKGLH